MVSILRLIGDIICYTFLGVLGIVVVFSFILGLYGAFSKLFKEVADGIKNRKKNKKQFLISVGVICWFFVSVWWLCELFL